MPEKPRTKLLNNKSSYVDDVSGSTE